ncbi:MAG: ferredoxin [Bacilli bacterium]|nr:ferredoxin [Bacilli bacterium]
MAKSVTVLKDTCVGCGLCAASYPSVFEMDDDGLAKAVVAEVEDSTDAEEAAAACPAQAIEVK